MMGSIDFATKLKITPQTLIPGFGNFYRAALLSARGTRSPSPVFGPDKGKSILGPSHFFRQKGPKMALGDWAPSLSKA